ENMLDRRKRLSRIESENENSLCAARFHLAHGLCLMAEESAAQIFYALNEITCNVEAGEIVIGVEIADHARGIIDCDGAALREFGDQRVTLRRGQRVTERLEERGAACIVAGAPAMRKIGVLEGLDLQRHHFLSRLRFG